MADITAHSSVDEWAAYSLLMQWQSSTRRTRSLETWL